MQTRSSVGRRPTHRCSPAPTRSSAPFDLRGLSSIGRRGAGRDPPSTPNPPGSSHCRFHPTRVRALGSVAIPGVGASGPSRYRPSAVGALPRRLRGLDFRPPLHASSQHCPHCASSAPAARRPRPAEGASRPQGAAPTHA